MSTILEPALARGSDSESSERSFGLVFGAAFAIVALWPLRHAEQPRWWSVAVAAAFLIVAVARPTMLGPLNRVWLALGRLLHRVVSPLVMGLIFFLWVTPTGWIMRRLGKDVLSLARRQDQPSYWIMRARAMPEPETMKNQF